MTEPVASREPEISHADFERFSDFFYRKTGIVFDQGKRYFVDRRLQRRMSETGHAEFDAYFGALLAGCDRPGGEMQQLINAMTINETYFYREEYQFRCLVESLLPDLLSRRGPDETLRIWSIPAASGEEPYSLAIYLLEHWPLLAERNVELLASDIDTEMLDLARAGLYPARALHQLPQPLRDRYFMREAGGHRIDAMLRDAIAFSAVNVCDVESMRAWRDVDVVFCRNLLIYFDDLSRRQAAEALYDALRPGGYICLGHAESMSRISSLFTVRKFPDAIVYQKPIESRPR
ncbi:CheR family methyltransferase [Chitiniphilus eburneus]|uniref:protein-glutamate O-methyltransferase n=1 Tax=Chitiniphilus eburneus TaxID=2571148 RepID=A0A4U0QBI0_9NEIS|nr:protein-glutamate O-methyltransferase CheR [Chitiniphilus eburneus]TJZ78751.1 protein-glutamate O-methyltransferase CheR [Chitiniphilus eburneus]